MPIDASALEPPAPSEVVSGLEDTIHFEYPGPDIVLRSCDSHNFPVPKLYAINSSPVLRELVRSVSNTSDVPSGEEQEPIPVVKLPESGVTIYHLLTFIFPFIPIVPSTSEEIMELLAAAQRFQMDSVLSHIRSIIARQDPPFIRPATAFHMYLLARKHELHQEALQAACLTLRLPTVVEDLADRLDFSDMGGAYLHELWKYRERVRTDLKSGALEFTNSGLPEGVKGLRCKTPYSYAVNSFPRWLDKYIKSIADALHLFDVIEFENAWASHIKESEASYSRTSSCLDIPSQLIRAFWEALTAFIQGTIEKVRRAGVTGLHCDNQYEPPEADSALALVREEPCSESSDPPPEPLCLDMPDANVILRSSDQVNFRVHKSVLAMSSPFFEDLLSLPQPPDDELVNGLPVVPFPEDAGLLDSLISLLYPIRRVTPGSYDKMFVLLAACQKYDMDSIQSYIRDEVKLGRFPATLNSQAFGAYAIASSTGLIPEMENTAWLTLGLPMTFESLGEGLRRFKGRALCNLIHYRVASNI